MTALELLLIEKGMKGPGWLRLTNIKETNRLLTKGMAYELDFQEKHSYMKSIEVLSQ